MADPTEIAEEELQRRVVYSLIVPATRLAGSFGISLKDMSTFVQLSYLRQLRADGKTLREAADVMDVSERTAKRLNRRLRENFFTPEFDHDLPRQIEFMLWAQPMSLARMAQVLSGASEDEIRSAVDVLVEDGRAVLEEGRTPMYRSTQPVTRLVRKGWVPRIGALNSLLGNVYRTIVGRFFEADPLSFARTISFRIRRDRVDELRQFYEDVFLPRLEELEAEASDADGTELQLSLLWAPYADPTQEGDER